MQLCNIVTEPICVDDDELPVRLCVYVFVEYVKRQSGIDGTLENQQWEIRYLYTFNHQRVKSPII